MIWNNKILFIHTPKTAGMSMTGMLLESLDGPVSITGPFDNRTENGVQYLQGKRHETLVDAESFLTYRNKSIRDFEKIFCVMRNPYDLELSRYSYLRKNLPHDKGPAQTIALENDYKNYLRQAPFFGMNPPRLHLYFSINGHLPENLVVLKFERLNEDIKTFMSPYMKPGYQLPFENASTHKKYEEVYDEETEELCFERNRWFFEKGFYARENFS